MGRDSGVELQDLIPGCEQAQHFMSVPAMQRARYDQQTSAWRTPTAPVSRATISMAFAFTLKEKYPTKFDVANIQF